MGTYEKAPSLSIQSENRRKRSAAIKFHQACIGLHHHAHYDSLMEKKMYLEGAILENKEVIDNKGHTQKVAVSLDKLWTFCIPH